MINFRHVTYTYPEAPGPALADLTLDIGEGEFLLVIGDSGAGKSTLLRCINGLVPHFYGGRFQGDVTVDGCNTKWTEPRDLSARVGFVFQDPEAQFVVDTVEDELVFGMENFNVPPLTMRKRVEEVLDQLNIAHLRHRRISTLSGGEKQRVAIAAALTMQPQALVLDEPTSQLDPQAARRGADRRRAPERRPGSDGRPGRASPGAGASIRRSCPLLAGPWPAGILR